MTEYSPLVERIQRIKNVVAKMNDADLDTFSRALAWVRLWNDIRAAWNVMEGLGLTKFSEMIESEEFKLLNAAVTEFPIKASTDELSAVILDERFFRRGEEPPNDFFITMLGDIN